MTGPARDLVQYRQSTPATAGFPEAGMVAELVADQGHREIVQICDDHPANFADGARSAVIAQNFDIHVFGLHMQMRAGWAL